MVPNIPGHGRSVSFRSLRLSPVVAIALLLLGAAAAHATYTQVTTFAGGGGTAVFNAPWGLALTPQGELIVADSGHHQIKRVSRTGVVTVIAGTGVSGDRDGSASVAQFKSPVAVAYDASRNLIYVADTQSDSVKKIAADGTVSTFATGLANPMGLAVDASGNVYVSDSGNNKIREITPAGAMTTIAGTGQVGSTNGSALQAKFNQPNGLAISSTGALYIADQKNHLIRKLENGVVSTVAGSTNGALDGPALSAKFTEPRGIAFDGDGNLLVADSNNDLIRLVTLGANPAVTTIAGHGNPGYLDGAPLTAQFREPNGIVFAGAIFVADQDNNAIRAIYPGGVSLTSVAPNGGPLAAGTTIHLTGSGFTPDAVVKIGTTTVASVIFVSSTSLTATLPSGTPGIFSVSVTTAGGSATLANAFEYVAAPAITSLAPAAAFPGQQVTIAGTSFRTTPADNQVAIGGVAATIVSASATQLVVTVPATAPSGPVTVTTIGGTATSPQPLTILAWTSLAVSPASATIQAGSTQAFHAIAHRSDGADVEVTAAWSTSAPAIASVTASGIATGLAAGTATITATFQTFTANAQLTVQSTQTLPPDPATVAPPIDPTVVTTLFESTKFLYTGTNPIQTGVAPGTIDLVRAAVLRGRVLAHGRQPLPGVTITITGHPEYGSTLSRADGAFDLAVNGGGPLTVQYRKSGFVPADRNVNPRWDDYAFVDDVILTPYDAAVTAVDLTAPGAQLARGSVSSDVDGTRQATLIFTPGTTAAMTMPDGTSQPLTSLHVRATELTVGPEGPKSMPAPLPPSSGYTYCVDLSADEAIAAGASSVTFSKPVPLYFENFLQFPAGTHIPVGVY
ncbi:MAG TPA: IPT/TIG domain-containing protein, partial [Thermoanaerobaculia bacterium]|nr:IPT/TIG domain-containing protein [Thermoanaerobaculia bacterium]